MLARTRMPAAVIEATPAVSLRGVTKRFGRHTAVDDLSIEVPAGSIYGFIGPNGSGKTTTLRMILHIFHPDAGTIQVLGCTGTRAASDAIGYLPEERGLYKKMSVRRLLLYYAALKSVPADAAEQRILTWLERLKLSSCLHLKVEALSKGMAQKIQFIAAVIGNPQLLILDEPFSGLDPVNLEVLREAILSLRVLGTTIIFSTHDMFTAESMCDRIFMIYRGRKVLDGSLASIQQQYGADTIRLRVGGGRAALEGIVDPASIRDLGQCQEIRWTGNPQALLQTLASRTSVEHFEITRPSLHDIFVRIAGVDAPAVATHA